MPLGVEMGLFLFILGIFLVLNIAPVIFGFIALDEGEYFLGGFLGAWVAEIVIAAIGGVVWLIIWLISTGWTMMQAPPEIY